MVKKHNRRVKTNIYAIKRKDNNQIIGYLKNYTVAQEFLNSQWDRKTKTCHFYTERTNIAQAMRNNVKLEEIVDESALNPKKTEE